MCFFLFVRILFFWFFVLLCFVVFDWSSHNSPLFILREWGFSCGLVYRVEQDIILIIIDCCLQAKLPLGDMKALLSLHCSSVAGERLMENCPQLVTLFSVSLYLLRIKLHTHITTKKKKSQILPSISVLFESKKISQHLKVHCVCFGRKIFNFFSKLKQTHALFPWLNKTISKLTSKDNTVSYWFTLFISGGPCLLFGSKLCVCFFPYCFLFSPHWWNPLHAAYLLRPLLLIRVCSRCRFSHHMVPGPPGPHATGIPHPAIVNPQVKHEPLHETDIMHMWVLHKKTRHTSIKTVSTSLFPESISRYLCAPPPQ